MQSVTKEYINVTACQTFVLGHIVYHKNSSDIAFRVKSNRDPVLIEYSVEIIK